MTTGCTGCTGWINHCCWRTDGDFPVISQVGVFSQDLVGASPKSVWVADLPSLPAGAPPTMTALRINGHRVTLARFPNANPELDIFPKGYISSASWLPPAPGPTTTSTPAAPASRHRHGAKAGNVQPGGFSHRPRRR